MKKFKVSLLIFWLFFAISVFAQNEKIYMLGDKGPAGGIIFYDKGMFSDGWRYLEVAPAETEFSGVQWLAYFEDVADTSTEIGTGKRNTLIILETLKHTTIPRQRGRSPEYQEARAAQLCATLNYGGYRDWFLPSRDELNIMYINLQQNGLGGFSNGWYWSSSQNNNWGYNYNGSPIYNGYRAYAQNLV